MILVLQIVVIANILGGENVRKYFKFVPRNWFNFLDEKKWIMAVGIFIFGNVLQSMCSATGAFEVFINNNLVKFYNLDLV